MKIRLIEPDAARHAHLVQGPASPPRPADHRRDAQGSTATTCSSTTRRWRPSTGTTSTRPTSSGISTTTRRRRPPTSSPTTCAPRGIPVVIGGSHVTFMADEALEHADYVARGEGGEQLMLELIEALAGDRELETIAGLSFTRDGVAVHNQLRERCADLDDAAVPRPLADRRPRAASRRRPS